ncbi:hypothetical protein ACEQPO_23965 [Bacillus sp. SL00103]
MEDGYGSEDDIAIVTDTGLIPLSGVSTSEPAVKKRRKCRRYLLLWMKLNVSRQELGM